MSLFRGPEEHAENPPETWQVTGAKIHWHLTTKDGTVLDSFRRRKDAEDARTSGRIATLYAKETRWYAGEKVDNWRLYS